MVLKQLDISFFNYLDESNYQFLLIDPGVLNIKKPIMTKMIKLHNQKDPELSIEKVREKFPNAYMPWGSEEIPIWKENFQLEKICGNYLNSFSVRKVPLRHD